MNRSITPKTAILAAAIVIASVAHAAIHEVNMPIAKVTVYPGRANITRVVDLELESGAQTVIVKSLPMSLDVASLRASAGGVRGITLVALNHKEEHHETIQQEEVAALTELIENVKSEDLRRVHDRLATFEEQKKLLAKITSGSGQHMSDQVDYGKINIDQWQAAFSFIGDRQREISDSIRVAGNEKTDLELYLRKLHSDLESLRGSESRSTRTVQIDLDLEKSGPVSVNLEYMIGGAGWKPIYDARLVGEEPTVQLGYYAEVTQRTGEDWDNVQLTLSTVEPSRGTGPPELSPWYLSVREIIAKQPVTSVDELREKVAGVVTNSSGEIFIRGGRAGEVAYIVDGVPIGDPLGGLGEAGAHLSLVSGTITELETYATSFRIKRRETVPSGSEAVRTIIAQLTFDGTLDLICRPKLLEGAYRQMSMTNDKEIPLMPGQVSVFAESDYLGRVAMLQLIAPGQEFELPFGVDNSIEVERKLLRQMVDEKGSWLSQDTYVRHETEIEIKLTNNSSVTKLVQLEEPLPVSQDDRIKVKADDFSPKAEINETKEKAVWELTLEPGAKQTVSFRYHIDHPQDLQVVGM